MLYSNDIGNLILGAICNNCTLMFNSKMPLNKSDFEPNQFHEIIFVCVYNIALKGAKEASEIEIAEFLENYPAQNNIFKDNDGIEYIRTIKALSKAENYEYYWNTVKKYSLLREYKATGFEIQDIYDENKNETEERNKFDKCQLKDIINYFDSKQCNIKKHFAFNEETEEMICGDGFADLLDELEKEPMVGGQLASPILTNLYRGWCKGHLILRGAPSSFGKTLMSIMDLIMVGSLKLYDEKEHKFIDNQYYQGKAVLIHSEQKSETEIQTRVISVLSKVNYSTILDGKFTKEEKERLLEAGNILKKSEFKIVNYPNFTATGMRELCQRLSIEGYEYFYQDYIWNNSYIISDMKKTMGLTNISEPNALLHFSNQLKMIAEEYNIAMATSMQLNDNYKTAEIIDESCLYASKAVKTKLDNGCITTYPREKDIKQVDGLISKWNRKNNTDFEILRPNVLTSCFKTRYGRYGDNIRIWSYMDKSVGNITDMFVTDANNNPINIKPMYIESV